MNIYCMTNTKVHRTPLIHIYIYIHTYTYIHIHIHIYTYIHTYIHIYISIYMRSLVAYRRTYIQRGSGSVPYAFTYPVDLCMFCLHIFCFVYLWLLPGELVLFVENIVYFIICQHCSVSFLYFLNAYG